MLQKSYLELFELAPELHFSSQQIAQMREELKKAQDYCVAQYKKRASDYEARLKQTQSQLKRVSARADDTERHKLHCEYQPDQPIETICSFSPTQPVQTTKNASAAKY